MNNFIVPISAFFLSLPLLLLSRLHDTPFQRNLTQNPLVGQQLNNNDAATSASVGWLRQERRPEKGQKRRRNIFSETTAIMTGRVPAKKLSYLEIVAGWVATWK